MTKFIHMFEEIIETQTYRGKTMKIFCFIEKSFSNTHKPKHRKFFMTVRDDSIELSLHRWRYYPESLTQIGITAEIQAGVSIQRFLWLRNFLEKMFNSEVFLWWIFFHEKKNFQGRLSGAIVFHSG